VIEYSRIGTVLDRNAPLPCFPPAAPQGRRDAMLCGWFGEVEQRRPDGTVIRYQAPTTLPLASSTMSTSS